MKATITTHILDTSRGKPAVGVAVQLDRRTAAGAFETVASGVTDDDGRLKTLTPAPVDGGVYRLAFDVAGYFGQLGVETFYPTVQVVFEAKDGHHHVPLLLAPHGYGTYRGS